VAGKALRDFEFSKKRLNDKVLKMQIQHKKVTIKASGKALTS